MRASDILAERSRRARLFPHMNEPTWLILIDLFVNDGRDVSVTSACLASCVPPTTALRYIGRLEADGLVRREDHPGDRRSILLRLTGLGRERLTEFFDNPLHHLTDNHTDAFSTAATGGGLSFHSTSISAGGEHDHA
jgi:DNA-binding MarR family transcriptional regulator